MKCKRCSLARRGSFGLALPALPALPKLSKWTWVGIGVGSAALLYLLFRKGSTAGATFTNRPITSDIYDTDIWNAPLGPNTYGPEDWSAGALDTAIDQFNVEWNPRYAPRILPGESKANTFCNIFVQDVMRSYGIELPWGVANSLVDWLRSHWRTVSGEAAQERANEGYPTIATYRNNSGGAGHVAVVRPGIYSPTKGPMTANAGQSLFNNKPAINGFGQSRMSSIRYVTYG